MKAVTDSKCLKVGDYLFYKGSVTEITERNADVYIGAAWVLEAHARLTEKETRQYLKHLRTLLRQTPVELLLVYAAAAQAFGLVFALDQRRVMEELFERETP